MKMITLIAVTLLSLSAYAKSAPFNGYIVKLKEGASKSFMNQKSTGIVEVVQTSHGEYLHVQQLPSDKALQAEIEYVEPNYILGFASEASGSDIEDSKFTEQWGLNNTGKNSSGWFFPGKAGEDIRALDAWEITKGSRDVIVAVIDTGVDYNHMDLKENMWVNEAEKNGTAGVDDDGNGYVDDIYGHDFVNNDADPLDDHGHGTHCAGVIGASHNPVGIAGIMKDVRIMALKFLSAQGQGDTIGAIKSIEYATKNGAHVMSNSWGGGEKSQALKEAIEAANEKGIVFVVAAGNSRNDNDATPTYPANYQVENVISVGAMSGKGTKASFSNYGKNTVHVFAPGENILSTVINNGYQKMSGTSMAAPHVSGMVGLLLSQEPHLTPAEVRERIVGTAFKSTLISDVTVSGRADAFRMLENHRQQ